MEKVEVFLEDAMEAQRSEAAGSLCHPVCRVGFDGATTQRCHLVASSTWPQCWRFSEDNWWLIKEEHPEIPGVDFCLDFSELVYLEIVS